MTTETDVCLSTIGIAYIYQ